jgi:polyisoprenoid-binding protein YceI
MHRLRTKKGLLLGAGGLLALVVGGIAFAYFVLFPTSAPKQFSVTAATSASASSVKSKSGSWVVATGSQAGYRVREKLAFLPAKNDAVGRTSSITGSADISTTSTSSTINAAAFKIDVGTLASDRSMRDQRIHQIGLQSDQYPTATFKLTTPIKLPAGAASGKVLRVPATGVFTIHGVAKTETVPLSLTITGSALHAAGSLTFDWGTFGMTAPSVGGFVNVEDTATMEFDLRLKPS